jgi:hypothetical protein
VNSVLTLASYYRGDREGAYPFAAKAVKDLPAGESSWNSMAVLTIFAEGRWMALKAAVKEKREWPSSWLTDLDAAYSALLHHPLSTEGQVAWHYDTMMWLGAKDRAARVIKAGVERFPDSPILHGKLRMRILRDRGVRELEAVYDEMLAKEDAPGNLYWYAGYASVVVADFHRRFNRRDDAVAALGRAIKRYEQAIEKNPKSKKSAEEQIALALAGRARLAYERGDDEAAVSDIVESFARSPGTAGTKDGVGITPAATAQMLLVRLIEEKKPDLIAKLETAIGKLDPALLLPEEDK